MHLNPTRTPPEPDDAPPPASARAAARPPNSTNTRTPARVASEGSLFAVPQCECGQPAGERTTMKEGPNKGRKFWVCVSATKCKYFKWSDEMATGNTTAPRGPVPPAIPAKRTREVGLHLTFYASGILNILQQQAESDRKCLCGLEAVSRTVTKESPNKGLKFWVCPNSGDDKCKFFEWDIPQDDAPAAGSSRKVARTSSSGVGVASGSGSKPGSCFNVSRAFVCLSLLLNFYFNSAATMAIGVQVSGYDRRLDGAFLTVTRNTECPGGGSKSAGRGRGRGKAKAPRGRGRGFTPSNQGDDACFKFVFHVRQP